MISYDHFPIYATLVVKGYLYEKPNHGAALQSVRWFRVPVYSHYDLTRMISVLRREYSAEKASTIREDIKARLGLPPDQFYIEWPEAPWVESNKTTTASNTSSES